MLSANHNKRVTNILLFVFFLVIISVLGIFSFSSIPVQDLATASLEHPENDFITVPDFTPGEGITATYYKIGLLPNASAEFTTAFNYRVDVISMMEGGEMVGKNYGIYEAYYSNDFNSNTKNDAVDYIVRSFIFQKLYFYSEKPEGGEWEGKLERTDFDVIYADDTTGYDNIFRPYTTGPEDPPDYEPADVNISSCTVIGERWDGSQYTGQLRNIDAAGTYQIQTLSVTYGGQTYSLNDLHLMILLKARLTVSASQFSSLFVSGKQFGLTALERTYGVKPNLRDLAGVSNTVKEAGKFYFSAGADTFFYLTSFGKNGSGVNVDSPLVTNLNNVKDYLEIEWYKYELINFKPVRMLIEDDVIKDAGEYSLGLKWTVGLNRFAQYNHEYYNGVKQVEADMTKVVDIVYGTVNDYEDFYKEITIEKRKLKFSEDKTATGGLDGGVQIKREVEFNGNTSVATNLFNSNTIPSKQMWLNLNGLESDYDNAATFKVENIYYTFAQYLNKFIITSFNGSHFDSAAIGEKTEAYMNINLNAANSIDAGKILENYEAVMGWYDGGTYYPFEFKTGTDYHILSKKYDIATGEILVFDGKFKVLPNKISLTFSKEANYTYGQKATISDFNFTIDPIVTASGTIYTNNWKVYIVKGLASDSAVRHATENRIYIGIMTGKRDNEALLEQVVYTDGEGNKYTMYNGRLYADDYYFYYTVYVLHASTTSSHEGPIQDQDNNNGFFTIKNREGNPVAELDLSLPKKLSINKLQLQVQVNSLTSVKNYDGTNALLNFNAQLTGGSIFVQDQALVTYSLTASYMNSKAGQNVEIIPNFVMKIMPGSEASPTAAKALNSYELDTSTILGASWTDRGTINKLNLTLNIVDNPFTAKIGDVNYPLYKRNFAENTYVLIQVAKAGDTLPDGVIAGENYYYYYYSRLNKGVVAESKLSLGTALGISSDKCVKMTMTGFLAGEGFDWDHSGSLVNFNLDPVDIKDIFSWVDTSRMPYVHISSTTDSSSTENDYYRIEYNTTEALNSLFDNYNVNIGAQSPAYAFLHIGKLDLQQNFLFVQENSIYNYTGQSQILSTVTFEGDAKAIFNFGGHLEAQNIVDTLLSQGKTFADLVEVLAFYRDCDETCPHGSYNLNSFEIKNMVISGTYTLRFNLPASRNYKGGILYATVQIFGKNVQAITTFAIRSYLENNPIYNTAYDKVLYVNTPKELALYSYWMKIDDETGTAYEIIAYPKLSGGNVYYYLVNGNTLITEGELQANYNATKVYIDFKSLNLIDQAAFDNAVEESKNVHGSTVVYYKEGDNYVATDTRVAGISQYYMFNEYTMNNTVIYYGFMVKNELGEDVLEAFSASDTTHQVVFSIGEYNDKAYTSGLDNGIRAQGAFKHNFVITNSSDKFFILKKALSISVGENTSQQGIYNGGELVPTYTLIGGDPTVGFLGINVHSYTYDGITTTLEYRINGILQPIENIPFGNNLEIGGVSINLLEAGEYTLRLYARPNSEYSMNYATSRVPTIITYIVLPLEVVFIGEDVSFAYNNSVYRLGAFNEYFSGENSNWGEVEIVDMQKGGISVTEIKNAGIYEVTIIGTLLEQFRKNLYFNDGLGGRIYDKQFSYTVTVTASSSYQFRLTNDVGGIDLEGENGFRYTYSGLTYIPTYIFNNLEEGIDDLPATYTVTNSQGIGSPIKNADIYTLVFEINAMSHQDYNADYASYEGNYALIFTVIVNKAPLLVTFGFEEGYTAKKTYLDDNSVIADHMFYIYTGWVGGEDGTELQNQIINSPIIDWDFFDGNKTITIGTETIAGIYVIKPKSSEDTTVLQNYELSYEGSAITFVIEKANPKLIVYGLFENDEYQKYYVYTGNPLEPNVKRKYKDSFIDEEEELIGSDGVRITLMGRFIGTDINNITLADIIPAGSSCIDVGEYVFEVEVDASNNYNAFPAAYFYLQVKKAQLYISVLGEYEGVSRGFATTVYSRTENYPTFNIQYSGFVGREAKVSYYNNPFPIYSYNLRQNTTQIPAIGLIHPVYHIYTKSDVSDEETTPYDAGTYYIKLLIDSQFGISTNYNINATYFDENTYPVLVITKRVLDIRAEDRITKTYDGTNRLVSGSVTKSKYSFTPKGGVASSGVVAGDENSINLSLNYLASYYERKDVNDANGLPTEIRIRIYGYSIDNPNYYMDITDSYLDGENRYFYLRGSIAQASTTIIFKYGGQVFTGKKTVDYNSLKHEITPEINGVNSEVLLRDIGYTLVYKSASYEDGRAPSEAGEYTVKVTIIDTNYVNSEVSVILLIEKASVIITFNGDASPVYATNNMGLIAYAEGVGGYTQDLVVSYYDQQGRFVSNIVKQDIGIYSASVVHNATTNFKYMKATTVFEIRPREVAVFSDVSNSYSYTGKQIVPTFTFEFNNRTYYPTLKYDTVRVIGNQTIYEPFNYNGNSINDNAPINVGMYRVSVAPLYGNFAIAVADTMEFQITPVNLVIGVSDVKIKENEPITFNFTLLGNVNGESINNLIVKPTLQYFDNNGTPLNTAPTAAGLYKIRPTGAFSYNYNISYSFGVLTINKSVLTYSSGAGGTDVIVEGNFTAETAIIVNAIENIQYTPYRTMFETFKINYPEYANYQMSTVYQIQFSNGTVEISENGKLRVKLLLADLLDKGVIKVNNNMSDREVVDIKMAQEAEYYIANFKSDGTVEAIKAQKEGDYIIFETATLEAFCLIIDAPNEIKDNSWVLYVSIAGGVLLILCVLLIIKKRA